MSNLRKWTKIRPVLVRGSWSSLLLTVCGVSILIVRVAEENPPRSWWTKLFRIVVCGWVIRLTRLEWLAPIRWSYDVPLTMNATRMTRTDWIDLDAQLLRVSRIRMREWIDPQAPVTKP